MWIYIVPVGYIVCMINLQNPVRLTVFFNSHASRWYLKMHWNVHVQNQHFACQWRSDNICENSVGHSAKWRHQMETFSTLLAICAGNSPDTGHKGQWRGALMFPLICAWINGWVNNREADDFEMPSRLLWRHCNGLVPYDLVRVNISWYILNGIKLVLWRYIHYLYEWKRVYDAFMIQFF